jgi:hypothetical protein
MPSWCEHCFVTANQFLKNPKQTILYKYTAPPPKTRRGSKYRYFNPLKNFIKNKKNPRTSADVPGVKMATIHQGEANEQDNLHTCRKGVYTPANEEATEKDSYAC